MRGTWNSLICDCLARLSTFLDSLSASCVLSFLNYSALKIASSSCLKPGAALFSHLQKSARVGKHLRPHCRCCNINTSDSLHQDSQIVFRFTGRAQPGIETSKQVKDSTGKHKIDPPQLSRISNFWSSHADICIFFSFFRSVSGIAVRGCASGALRACGRRSRRACLI